MSGTYPDLLCSWPPRSPLAPWIFLHPHGALSTPGAPTLHHLRHGRRTGLSTSTIHRRLISTGFLFFH
ncbi:hypothetical protein E2562_010132 [Oryza meyeriana var. granulata]|uniref:Uncharacterized protein n=1 Tax=Oryza meyeriana var. granulata TaxID=110450 RepID=A0A6G1EHD2_9ORYZ|nr:hypothetical protein E2562_010132 [Oryza meyeriana var. granulata]